MWFSSSQSIPITFREARTAPQQSYSSLCLHHWGGETMSREWGSHLFLIHKHALGLTLLNFQQSYRLQQEVIVNQREKLAQDYLSSKRSVERLHSQRCFRNTTPSFPKHSSTSKPSLSYALVPLPNVQLLPPALAS